MKAGLLTKEFLEEHLVPELEVDTVQYFDHLRRYMFAQQFVYARTVLDVACGTGYGSDMLGRAGAKEVVSIDISSEVLDYAQSQWGQINFIQGNAETLPIGSKTINVVVSFETLEHLSNPNRFLAEVARVLTADGQLILSVPNRNFASPGSNRPYSPYHTFEPTLAELKDLLESEGWQILDLLGLIHTPQVANFLTPVTSAFSRSSRQVAWSAYLRKWIHDLVPAIVFRLYAKLRKIPMLSIADAILTEAVSENSCYFVVRCRKL